MIFSASVLECSVTLVMSGLSRRAGELCRLHQVGMKSCLFVHPIARQTTFAASKDGSCAGGQPIAVTHNFQAAAAGNSLDTGARVEVARPAAVGSLAFLASEVDRSRQEVTAPTCSCDTDWLHSMFVVLFWHCLCTERRCLPLKVRPPCSTSYNCSARISAIPVANTSHLIHSDSFI